MCSEANGHASFIYMPVFHSAINAVEYHWCGTTDGRGCFYASSCFIAESSKLFDSGHRSSTFHCDSQVDVEQVRTLMSRVRISLFPFLLNVKRCRVTSLGKLTLHVNHDQGDTYSENLEISGMVRRSGKRLEVSHWTSDLVSRPVWYICVYIYSMHSKSHWF